ncbi:uncharacterized protein LOC126909212 [Daktulosphaira vitifoliae]|uniref:uncharacterized protein LOC126896067 n=1 Tax=Daktulosphaira vitifoliae TaxID=58002 RepID=UPI0021AAFDFC|nr:uncharacterized protein LOC126896067 [Daktulosphaira vitifoliae]XP_050547586.1 uncharacterized protein LOC126909212 [Daktulosphaira vitifoliae]
MYREFTARGSRKWINILDLLMEKYNNSKHRTIGMTPIQADKNPLSVKFNHRKVLKSKAKFRIGQKVRISIYKTLFIKGYIANWSSEIFTIAKVNNTLPVTYMLEDYTGAPIKGCFYEHEIQLTKYPDDFLIERIIKRKNSKVLVKWLGYDTSHNSWISVNDIKSDEN